MKTEVKTGLLVLMITALLPQTAFAYVGPGLGFSVVGSLLGIAWLGILGIALTVLWPLWLIVRYFRSGRNSEAVEASKEAE